MTACSLCNGSGDIPRGTNKFGDRLSEVCGCPAGDDARRFIDVEEARQRVLDRRMDRLA